MVAYLPYSVPGSDYAHIRINGLWYQEWQAGYHHFLKRGYPRPSRKTTVLAELHSPVTPDFLHGGDGDVPFLVSPRARAVIRQHGLTGVRFSSVEVVKVATKGSRIGPSPRRGPEDLITKARDQLNAESIPKLYAARVCGRFEIVPQFPSGVYPEIGYVTPYDLPATGDMPDLWRPTIRGRTFAAWVYCSERFRAVITQEELSNIGFQSFAEHMAEFRRDAQARAAEVARAATSGDREPGD